MSSKNNEKIKNSMELKKEISQIFVANNSKLKPYLEIFQHNPENIIQQPLGILVGFFEVKEYSDDSAYIVNFLNSVLKKEYYANPKKSISESFDSALHKINLALSEITKHGNVNWLGKLDAAICVIEKNSIYFSSTGKAKILIFRKDSLSSINDDFLQEETELHPVKTFINVSSGRLEKDDKFIITSENIFNIFSINDLEKNILRLPPEKFVQLLKTALTNELDLSGTIIIDVIEEKLEEKIISSGFQKKSTGVNFFSEKTFSRKKTAKKITTKEANENEMSLPTENPEEKNEYVDKKTGHIYIQETGEQNEDNTNFKENISIVTEIFAIFFHNFKVFFKKQGFIVWRKTIKKIREIKLIKPESKAASNEKLESETKPEPTPEPVKIISEEKFSEKPSPTEKKEIISQKSLQEKLAPFFNTTKEFSQKMTVFIEKILRLSIQQAKKIFFLLAEKYSNKQKEIPASSEAAKKTFFIFPDISVIKNLFHSFSYKQKTYALILILIILLGPLAILKLINGNKKNDGAPVRTVQPQISETERLSREKNIIFIDQPEKTLNVANAIEVLSLENSIIAISSDKVTIINDQDQPKDFLWTKELGIAKKVTHMKDLNIFLIATDQKKIVSFSPISLEFKDNSIQLPDNYEISPMATYLTYLYLLDNKNNQIYRYPRAEGGFGAGSTWIKDTVDLSNISDISIDENLYLSKKNDLKKLFRGKIADLSLEKSNTPINFDYIYTDISLEHIYALDKQNSRVIQFNKNGEIIKQYHNKNISNANEFSVNEKNRKIYIATPQNISIIGMQ
ncbi:MAG: hypothetical protein ACD_11C00103G0053 [uncultured bacterium]|nr:MAG: hypothetical protein ACD_11C00103G0053 [uncultured bacterium]